ncbi:MAG: thiamine pyrophosphate-dependent enzyme [Bacteroidaceae bacterium]
MDKRLFLGDQAIAQGALDAGLSGVYAYPGTPSTEITEFIQESKDAQARGVHSRWSTNEKTAMESALGMSYMGKRAMVCMKHVGVNVCADPFVNSAMTGVNGGLVLVVADDPSMHSSQDEQDSRFYAKFAMVPLLEPSNQQEAYNMIRDAFDMSEELKLPVVLRVTTRMAHSRAVVTLAEKRSENSLNFDSKPIDWVLLPVNARRKNDLLCAMQPELVRRSEEEGRNLLISGKAKTGVIVSGIACNYVEENFSEGITFPMLKIKQYPIPHTLINELSKMCEEILVIEEGQPFIEEQLRGVLDGVKTIKGKLSGELPRTGELTPDSVAKAFGLGEKEALPSCKDVTVRPPALCAGCGHRDVYAALNAVAAEYENARIFGDIGCYTLGALPPFRALASCVDMGASITMAKGAADAGLYPAIAIIGDSTFTHSGMTGLLDAINENANITVVISDNLTTAMTGGQDSAGLNKYEAICLGLGVLPEHLHVVVPLPKNMDEITRVIRQEVEYKGLSVIIPRRECIQTLARHNKAKRAAVKK